MTLRHPINSFGVILLLVLNHSVAQLFLLFFVFLAFPYTSQNLTSFSIYPTQAASSPFSSTPQSAQFTNPESQSRYSPSPMRIVTSHALFLHTVLFHFPVRNCDVYTSRVELPSFWTIYVVSLLYKNADISESKFCCRPFLLRAFISGLHGYSHVCILSC